MKKTKFSIDMKTVCVLAMLSALAFAALWVSRVAPPVVLFLKYDPKDVVIAIGGFLYGPLAAFAVTVAVSLVEMVTVSTTGFIGLVMNIVAGCAFACTASFIYKKRRRLSGAVIGLTAAWLLTTAVMLLWNYLITPLFMHVPREEVAKLLLPAFLPFNLLKGGLNAALTMLLYKPVKAALKASHLTPALEPSGKTAKINLGVILVSIFVVITCALLVLVMQGKL